MITKLHVFNALACILLALVALLGACYVYSAFFETPWLYYKNMPFHVSGQVYAGGPAVALILRCSSATTTQAYSTTRAFQKMGANQAPSMLPSLSLTVEPGCEPAISRINIVPDNTLPGWYRFFGKASIRGLFVEHEVDWATDFFEVVARPTRNEGIVVHSEKTEIKLEVKP